jgi:hypothetical protein
MKSLALVLLSLVIACSATHAFFVRAILAADDPRNIAGYDRTVWGMSEDEVLNAESPLAEKLDKPVKTAAGDIRSITIKEIKIASTEFRVMFIFDSKNRKLKQVTLEGLSDISPARTFSSIEKLLTEKYGAATYRQEGRNVSWKLPKTLIQLVFVNIPSVWTQVFVTYQPAEASADASKNL